jgi:carbamate kinase
VATLDAGQKQRSIVIALGGNAILPMGRRGTYDEQRELTRQTMDQVAQLAEAGHRIVVTHGNGPVVGNIVLRGDAGEQVHGIPAMPMYVCGADSQGGIGYMIQQSLRNALRARGIDRTVAAVVTQVVVDPADAAFQNPTKFIGPFYDAEQAARLEKENGWSVREDKGRGFRRVVPSPQPTEVVEWPAIKALIEAGIVTVAVGGGGVPVFRDESGDLAGIDAVIDKDRASDVLARLLGADDLLIITQTDRVYRRFGEPDQEAVDRLTVSAAREMLAAGEFPAGSMGPKIEAAISFLEGGGQRVIITDPPSILAAYDGQDGTAIVAD